MTISGEHGNKSSFFDLPHALCSLEQTNPQLYKINTALTNAFAISSQTGEPSVKILHREKILAFPIKEDSKKRDNIQCSPFIMLCFRSIGMDCVISESCNKETTLQRNYI